MSKDVNHSFAIPMRDQRKHYHIQKHVRDLGGGGFTVVAIALFVSLSLPDVERGVGMTHMR